MRRGLVLLRLWLGLSFRTAPVLATTRATVSVLAAVLGPLATLGTGAVVDGLTRGDDRRARWGLVVIAAFLLVRVLDGFVAWTLGATLEDLSERDTAQAMNVSVGTVKSTSSRALAKLRRHPSLHFDDQEVSRARH